MNSKNENDFYLKMGEIDLHLTNQNKIYFPDDGISKGDVVNYYNSISTLILPYLKGRPQSMHRFPNGINGESFYQKDVNLKNSPSWLETKKIYSESNDKYIDYLLCNNNASLLYMANLGCIEFNPWNSTIDKIDKPDWAVIDLDPANNDFKEVVKTALTVKKIMDELETECYCKTSGATGLHIYIPLAAQYGYDSVRLFSELIANEVVLRLPEITSVTRSLGKRRNKIYIDFMQNRQGQTLASAYCVRPRPGATVSTPLEWGEVNEKLSPSLFTIKNVMKRFDQKGDLWKPVLGKGANLEMIIKKFSENPRR
jgi:bifunctional non-homologous end joining protein LigD